MKKYLMMVVMVALVFSILAGCAKAPATEKESDMMDKPTEAPMTEAPLVHATDEPMAEESEEPMEEDKMMMGVKTEDGYIDLTPEEAKKLIDSTPDLVIIDVSPKYDQGHLPGAINYYVGSGALDEAIPSLDKAVPYLVYCHVDSASISGSKKLVAAGFEPVYRLIGNYAAWVDAGYPVE